MDLRPSEQQAMLRDSARRFLREEHPFETRRARPAGGTAGTWTEIAALGWPGAALPEEVGGHGGSVVEFAILMEEMGRALYGGPFLSTSICAAMLHGAGTGPARDRLARIAAGAAKAAFAHGEPGGRGFLDAPATVAVPGSGGYRITGRKRLIHDLAAADSVLVSAATPSGLGLFVVEADARGIARRDYATIDQGSASDLEFDDIEAELVVDGERAERALDEGLYWMAVGLGAEAVGVADAALGHTKDYVAVRKQFGRALSDFQVVQHRLADMFVEVEQLRSSLLNALAAERAAGPERRRAALGLKILAGAVATKVAGDGLHLHGGMGMTDAMPISHYYRRARALEAQHGNSDHFLAGYARLLD